MQAQGYAQGAAAYAGAATGAVAAAGAGADDQRKPSYVCGSQYSLRARPSRPAPGCSPQRRPPPLPTAALARPCPLPAPAHPAPPPIPRLFPLPSPRPRLRQGQPPRRARAGALHALRLPHLLQGAHEPHHAVRRAVRAAARRLLLSFGRPRRYLRRRSSPHLELGGRLAATLRVCVAFTRPHRSQTQRCELTIHRTCLTRPRRAGRLRAAIGRALGSSEQLHGCEQRR